MTANCVFSIEMSSEKQFFPPVAFSLFSFRIHIQSSVLSACFHRFRTSHLGFVSLFNVPKGEGRDGGCATRKYRYLIDLLPTPILTAMAGLVN